LDETIKMVYTMKISTAKRNVTMARKALHEDASPEHQEKFDEATRVLADLEAAAVVESNKSPEDVTIEANLDGGKDAVIIKLAQEHGHSLAKAAVLYRSYATAHGLDEKKDSMSHQLIDWFTNSPDATAEEIQKHGEELGLSKSSINYYKTMLKLAKDVASRL